MRNYRALFTVPSEGLVSFLPFNDSHLYPLFLVEGIRLWLYLWVFCISPFLTLPEMGVRRGRVGKWELEVEFFHFRWRNYPGRCSPSPRCSIPSNLLIFTGNAQINGIICAFIQGDSPPWAQVNGESLIDSLWPCLSHKCDLLIENSGREELLCRP